MGWLDREKEKVEEYFHNDETEEKVNKLEGLSYLNGNKHAPVIIVGDAPDSEDGTKNVLAVRLGTSEVFAASDIREEESTPASPTVVNTGSETGEELEAQIAALQAKKETLEGS